VKVGKAVGPRTSMGGHCQCSAISDITVNSWHFSKGSKQKEMARDIRVARPAWNHNVTIFFSVAREISTAEDTRTFHTTDAVALNRTFQ
jgi:hypothetical protein